MYGYRPLNGNVNTFLNAILDLIILAVDKKNTSVLVFGDFNLRLIKT